MFSKFTTNLNFKKITMSCIVPTCGSERIKDQHKSFHSFPKANYQKWLDALGINSTHWRWRASKKICSLHFEADCFDRTGQTTRIRQGSVPTLFLPLHQAKDATVTNSHWESPIISQTPHSIETLFLPVEHIEEEEVVDTSGTSSSISAAPDVKIECCTETVTTLIPMIVDNPLFVPLEHKRSEDDHVVPLAFGESSLPTCSSTIDTVVLKYEDGTLFEMAAARNDLHVSPGINSSNGLLKRRDSSSSDAASDSSETKRKRLNLIKVMHNYSCTPGKYKRDLETAKEKVTLYKKRFNHSQQTIRRLRTKILLLEVAIKKLRKENDSCSISR